jgi:hypothetical protein
MRDEEKDDLSGLQVGAVLTFPVGVSQKEVREALGKLGIEIDSATVASFDGRYGGPVWYIP